MPTLINLRSLLILTACVTGLAQPTLTMATEHTAAPKSDAILLSSFARLQSWKAISKRELVLTVSPTKSYLVTLQAPYPGLRFAQAIGVTTSVGRVTHFDSVLVEGQRLPIDRIARIDPDAAKAMRWKSEKI